MLYFWGFSFFETQAFPGYLKTCLVASPKGSMSRAISVVSQEVAFSLFSLQCLSVDWMVRGKCVHRLHVLSYKLIVYIKFFFSWKNKYNNKI